MNLTLGESSVCQNQVFDRNTPDSLRREVDGVVAAIKSRVPDAISTARDRPRVEMATRLITGSSRHRPNNAVQNTGQRGFSGKTEDTPLMMTSGRTDLNFNNKLNEDTRKSKNIKDSIFAGLKSNYDRQLHTLYMVTGPNALQSNISDFLTGRTFLWDNPLPQHSTKP